MYATPLPLASETKPFEQTISDVVVALAPTGIGSDSVTGASLSSVSVRTCAAPDGGTYVVTPGSAR